jgi:pimeloyl-ACP methyl ester carboxylesterase
MLASGIAAGMLAACAAVPDLAARRLTAERQLDGLGWRAERVDTGRIELQAWHPPDFGGAVLTVYIEGDGFAWQTPTRPSTDPTPIDPVALKLAIAHPSRQVAYLARPCQYVGPRNCSSHDWTDGRFSEASIAASDNAVDRLKLKAGAAHLILVGYSGGGAVASLLATRRDDVIRLVTIAGNLDHRAWTTLHRIDPLVTSLNPADRIDTLARIPQLHFVGGRDRIIPPQLVASFVARFPENRRPQVVVEPEFDHHCCWVEAWPRLLRQANLANQDRARPIPAVARVGE